MFRFMIKFCFLNLISVFLINIHILDYQGYFV